MNCDVLVLGAGPAGSTVARLLARWGYRVLLIPGSMRERRRSESLPPSIRNLFDLLEISSDIESAGFFPDGGNTSWWTSGRPRVEHFPPGATGYHVDRQVFDRLLLDLARQAGVTVVPERPGGLQTRFTIDASGRFGSLARNYRRVDPRYRTVAFCAEWQGQWDAEPSHALVEAYATGWAWSVPLSANRRQLAFMVDHGERRGGLAQAYGSELERCPVLSKLFERARMDGEPWASNATIYDAAQYAGEDWILTGDAGCTVDPLSSFGVKKSLISAWMAAAVVNTCLGKPSMADAAREFYQRREAQTFSDHVRLSAMQFEEIARSRFDTPFWSRRSVIPEHLRLYDPAGLSRAWEAIRGAPDLRLRLSKPPELRRTAALSGREVVWLEREVIPGLAPEIEYLQGVNLVQLAKRTPRCTNVPQLLDEYNKIMRPVALPALASALSYLVACGVLAQDISGSVY